MMVVNDGLWVEHAAQQPVASGFFLGSQGAAKQLVSVGCQGPMPTPIPKNQLLGVRHGQSQEF